MTEIIQPFSFQYTRSNAGLSCAHALPFERNQVIWLVGNSGSGKSTFLHLLKGFYPEFINGTVTGDVPCAFARAAYLAQNPLSQIVHERVGEEFFFSMENAQYAHEQLDEARVWLTKFGLDAQEFSPTNHLSHGLAQRLLLASMLALQPDWIVFDEPTAFLNPAMRDEFYSTLKNLKGQLGMLIIDHHAHVAQVADVCWHVADDGTINQMSVGDWLALQQSLPQSVEPMPPVADVELHAHQLVVGHKKRPLFTANFSLKSGECAVLLGDNGTGKSSLFNTLAGVLKPLQGEFSLRVAGAVVKPVEHMAYVFQHPDSHFFFDTIEEELQQLGVSNINEALAHIGLGNRAQTSPHQLSEGQKRRLTLLYPSLQKRPLVLLDEPTFGQDRAHTERIIHLIQALKQAGYALVVITHDEHVQQSIATHIWRIQDGQFYHD